jgi:PST family polysaccharide transporter
VSVASKAVRGVAWNMVTGVGVRVIGLVSTLVLTRFIEPYEYGEVSAAVICVLTANQFSTFSFGQYLIAKNGSPEEAWHAHVIHIGLGAFAQLLVLALGHPLGAWLDAPHMARFLPGFAIANVIERMQYVPERLLQRQLRFRTTALVRAAGELTFIGVSLATAPRWHGYAIVIGGLARAVLVTATYLVVSDKREWLAPTRLHGATTRALFTFGLPASLGHAAQLVATKWDNLIISSLFGPDVMGRYALAYNLADTPTSSVADQIGDVMLPSFAKLEPEKRHDALIRSSAIMALLIFPLAIGLGVVAPTVVHAFFKPEWFPMADMLMILSVISVVKPITWPMGAFTYAQNRPRVIMASGLFKAFAIIGSLETIGRLGPRWACVAVGVASVAYLLVFALLLERTEKVPAIRLFFAGWGPLLACGVMVVAVLGVRHLRLELGLIGPRPGLVVEVATGAIAYVVAALILARSDALDFIRLVKNALSRRRAA